MRYNLQVGDSWGALSVQSMYYKDYEISDGAVTESGRACFAELKCACGTSMEMKASDFPGKRALRDCGCGAADEKKIKEYKTITSYYLPLGLLQAVDEWRNTHKCRGMSHAVAQLLQIGLNLGKNGD